MKFFYTGATVAQAAQNDPFQSLGGFASSSPVPNNALNNIFSDLSYTEVQQKKQVTRGLILQNTLGFDCTDVTIGYQYPTFVGATYQLLIAIVTVNGASAIERIPNSDGSPIMATFVEADIVPANSINNSIDLGPMANNAMFGVWLQLNVLTGVTPPSFSCVSDEIAWWQAQSAPTLNLLQTIQFTIEYTYN
jgi:hypothetical protein